MTQLPIRPVGSQGLKASAQGLGCMGMSAAYFDKNFAASEEESQKVIKKFREMTGNDTGAFLDTADVYGPHTNEVLVGKAVKGSREQYTIATKFGNIRANGQATVEGSPEYVHKAVHDSVQRLGIDYIDLYYQHRVDRTRPIEETWKALKELVEQGKVKYLGISEASPSEIRRAHAIHPISAVQLEWSLWTRDAEDEVIPTCRELGIGIIAFSPLGRGFLTGTIDDVKNLSEDDMRVQSQPRFAKENFERNLQLVQEVKQLAKAKGVTPGQLALAWVHHQGEDVFPIPGTKRLAYLEENVAAFHVKLSKQELDDLEAIFHGKVVGARYLPDGMKKAYYGGLEKSPHSNEK